MKRQTRRRRLGPAAPHRCKYCEEPADRSLIWADGRAYIPVCPAHDRRARNRVRAQHDSVVDVVKIRRSAVEQNLEVVTGEHFGQRVDARRFGSALAEAPPVGVGLWPLQVGTKRDRRREKALSFLQRLGTDWKLLRATKVHDNRIVVYIDKDRYTLYTRSHQHGSY